MPSVQVYVNRKLSDVQKHGAASCIIREISDKLGKPKELVAVFFMETTGDMAFSGSMGGAVCPTVQFAPEVSPREPFWTAAWPVLRLTFSIAGYVPPRLCGSMSRPPKRAGSAWEVCWYDVADGALYGGNIRLGVGKISVCDH